MGDPVQRSKRHRVTVVAVVSVLGVAAASGGFAAGHMSGADLDGARDAGASEGQKQGAAKGAARGYSEGLEHGRRRGYESTFRSSKAAFVPSRPQGPAVTRAATLWAFLVLGLVGVGLGGYFVARDSRPSDAEAQSVRRVARVRARVASMTIAFAHSYERGQAHGMKLGRASGRRAGARAGRAAAKSVLARRRAQALARERALEAAARNAAAEELAQRRRNCGAPLFVDGYCPTDAEIQQENDAESLCGPGTAEGQAEAERRGIQC